MKPQRIYARLVAAGCLCVLAIILVAGLWPFHAPRNDVTWLADGNGIRFGHHGTLVSAGRFQSDAAANSARSLEIWLSPDLAAKRKTILAFDTSAHPGEPFSLQQDEDALEIRRHNIDGAGVARTAVCEAGGVFRKGKAVFIAVTLSARQTVLYVDGVRAKTCAIAGASADNLSGTVVVANSAIVSNSWPGTILGLALYQRQLKPDEAAQDYESWTKSVKPALAETESPLALYLFDERSGTVVHNQLDAATNLRIPEHYLVLHPAFLELPWREYRPRWSYWADVGVNVAGFVPWGFCLAVYFYSVKKIARTGVTIVLLGFAASFTIEVLQFWLPTRNSGTTDLITNTLGTVLGLMLYRWSFTQYLLAGVMAHYGVHNGDRDQAEGLDRRAWDHESEPAVARHS
jgi:VanZ family protein